MNWRDILEGSNSHREPYPHNSHNPHKYPKPVNCEDCGNIEDRKTESEVALQDFIDLVRITAACDHHILLHRDAIAAELDQSDITELLKSDRRGRQVWAELLAFRLCRQRLEL